MIERRAQRARHFAWPLALLAILLAFGCAPAMPSTRTGGRHVVLYTDLPPTDAGLLAAEADAFVGAVSKYLEVEPSSPRVYVFRNGWNLWLYLRSECPHLSGRRGACFAAADGSLVVALRAVKDGRPAPASFRHELTHSVIARFADPMPWLDEGLAQAFESGCPPAPDPARAARLARMLRQLEPRLERLLRIARHGDLGRDDYLLAWGLTWFLVQDGADGKKAILRCLEPPTIGEGACGRAVRCLGVRPHELAARLAALFRGGE